MLAEHLFGHGFLLLALAVADEVDTLLQLQTRLVLRQHLSTHLQVSLSLTSDMANIPHT